MPLDPSIISSYNPTSGIDLNALMTQRMQGMANINEMERQRRADALALEDRAAAQKKAQEDEIVTSLLPAYAHVFKTGDLDGGLSLAPPQYRANLAPYVDALRGKPLEEIQAALAGSLVTSDAGRAFLENQARMTTAGIQQGQLEVSQGNLALDKAKLAAETSAGNKIVQWIQNDDGTATGLDAYGNIVKTVPGVGKKTAATGPGGVKLGPGEVLDPETQTVKLVPGTKEYNKQKGAHADDYKAARAAIDNISATASAVQSLKDTTGWQKAMNTGTVMGRAPNVPVASSYSGGYDFQTKYNNLKSAVAIFGRSVASMEGKLGNMAVQEWKTVADSIASLDLTNMDAATLDEQLDIIATKLQAAETTIRDAYEQQYGGGQFYAPLPKKGGSGGQTEDRGAPPAENNDPLGIRG